LAAETDMSVVAVETKWRWRTEGPEGPSSFGGGGLGVGYLAARLKPREWRYVHLSAMLLSAYNLFGGAVNEAYPAFVRFAGWPATMSSRPHRWA
jgi:hypothetical protein